MFKQIYTDYTWQRLKEDEGTRTLGEWLEEATEPFKLIPRYLVPSYFDVIIVNVYMILLEQCYNLMSRYFTLNISLFLIFCKHLLIHFLLLAL